MDGEGRRERGGGGERRHTDTREGQEFIEHADRPSVLCPSRARLELESADLVALLTKEKNDPPRSRPQPAGGATTPGSVTHPSFHPKPALGQRRTRPYRTKPRRSSRRAGASTRAAATLLRYSRWPFSRAFVPIHATRHPPG